MGWWVSKRGKTFCNYHGILSPPLPNSVPMDTWRIKKVPFHVCTRPWWHYTRTSVYVPVTFYASVHDSTFQSSQVICDIYQINSATWSAHCSILRLDSLKVGLSECTRRPRVTQCVRVCLKLLLTRCPVSHFYGQTRRGVSPIPFLPPWSLICRLMEVHVCMDSCMRNVVAVVTNVGKEKQG